MKDFSVCKDEVKKDTYFDKLHKALANHNRTPEEEILVYNHQRVNPYGFKVVKSKELSKPNDDRYVVINMYEEVMYDASGRGFKSVLSARRYMFKRNKELGYNH